MYIWKVYRFLFFIQFWCVFCCWMDCVECFWWYVDRFPLSFGSMSTDFLYLLVVCRQISSIKTLLKSYFYGLQLNIESYVKMNIIIFLKIWTSLNINCIWIIRWASSLFFISFDFDHEVMLNDSYIEIISQETIVSC